MTTFAAQQSLHQSALHLTDHFYWAYYLRWRWRNRPVDNPVQRRRGLAYHAQFVTRYDRIMAGEPQVRAYLG